MKIRILKKNNKSLFAKRNKGFYGRVFVLGADGHHVVLQHIKGKPKTHAVLTYCDVDLFAEINEKELLINAIQRHFLKKYKSELLFVKSSVSLPKFLERDGAHWLELPPIDNQTAIDFVESTEQSRASIGEAQVAQGVPEPDAARAGENGPHVKADGVRGGKRLPATEP